MHLFLERNFLKYTIYLYHITISLHVYLEILIDFFRIFHVLFYSVKFH